jgi:hypothetical protein
MNTVRHIPAITLAICLSSLLLILPGKVTGQAKQQPAPAKLSKVTGTLVSENGQPIKRQPLLLFLIYFQEGNELVAKRGSGQPVVMKPDNSEKWQKATTDDAGRFLFDGVPDFPTYTILFGADYEEALKGGQDRELQVKGRMFAFEVKDGADVKFGTIVTSTKVPAKSK